MLVQTPPLIRFFAQFYALLLHRRRCFGRGCGLAAWLLLLAACGSASDAAPRQAQANPPAAPPSAPTFAPDAESQAATQRAPDAKRWPHNDVVVVLDTGDVEAAPDGALQRRYHLIKKLFNARARSNAEFNFAYDARFETVTLEYARTIGPDGHISDVAPAEVRTLSAPGSSPRSADWRAMSFSFPAIADNCLIDYAYRVVEKPKLAGQFWNGWRFNSPNPVVRSRYTVRMPADTKLNYQVMQAGKISIDAAWRPLVTPSADGKTTAYTWERADLAPYTEETGMPAVNQINTSVRVSSFSPEPSDWKTCAEWFWKQAQGSITLDDGLRAKVRELTAGRNEEAGKARVLYDWVNSHVRSTGPEFAVAAYPPNPAPTVLNRLYGDSKDKSLLLIAMLKAAGIGARPALLRAGDTLPLHRLLPGLDWFNRCITAAVVNGKTVWMDAAAPACAYGDLPPEDRGADALLLQDGAFAFAVVPVYRPEQNGMKFEGRISQTFAGRYEANVTVSALGGMAQMLRGQLRALTPKQRQEFAAEMFRSFEGGKLKASRCLLPDDSRADDPFAFKIALDAQGDSDDEITYPTGFIFPSEPDLTAARRTQPLVIMPQQNQARITFAVPKGCKIRQMPANVIKTGPLHRYERRITTASDGASLTLSIIYTAQAGQVAPTEYAGLKRYLEELDALKEEEIVLYKYSLDTKRLPGASRRSEKKHTL